MIISLILYISYNYLNKFTVLFIMEYYNVLGVNKQSSPAEIKKAYRKSSLKWHPDKNGDSQDSKKKFQEIGEAYGVLSDPEKKQIYDRYGKQGLENQQNSGGVNPSDIFSQFFGGGTPFGGGFGGRPPQQSRTSDDKKVEIGITIEEMMNGSKKKIKLTRRIFCKICEGRGVKKGATDSTCRKCSGSGICIAMRQMGPMRIQQQFTCDVCNGSGFSIKESDKCQTCRGNKIVMDTELVEINIEKGSREGEYIQLYGKADVRENCVSAGDIFLIFRLKPNKTMSRVNDDLIVSHPIFLGEALSGLSIVFNHPNKEKIVIEYNDIIRKDSRFKVTGKGFYNKQTGKYGDLIFSFDIMFPNELNAQRKELLKKLLPKRQEEDDTNLSCYKLEKTNVDIRPPNMREEYEDINQNECVQQ